jgi:hypothetical protein
MADLMVSYHNAMEPESYNQAPAEGGAQEPPPNVELGVQDVGMSVPMGISAQNVSGIYAKIRSGAGNIEIGFPGAIRGQRQQQTPGMYGKDQRQAIRELGAINEVNFTTHSSYGIMGLSGFTGDNPYNVWFQKEYKKQAVDEIKRAIEFARDTAGGGSVVVHTGEIERPIADQPWAIHNGKSMFKQYEDEAELTRVRVVDDRTGQVQQVRKNTRVARPKWNRAKKDGWGEDIYGNRVRVKGPLVDEHGNIKLDKDGHAIFRGDYLDLFGRKIPEEMVDDPLRGRVPEYDEENRGFVNELYGWARMEEEAKERNERMAHKLGISVEEMRKRGLGVTTGEVHVRSTLETSEAHARGWGLQYSSRAKQEIEDIKKLRKALEFYQKLDKNIPESEKWKILIRSPFGVSRYLPEAVPPDYKNPVELIKEALKNEEVELMFANQGGQGQALQALDNHEQQQHMISATKYAISEAVKGYAEAGIHAMDCTINNKRPVTITMENIFPERYGGHPAELKDLIIKSREEMVKRLTEPKIEDPSGVKEGDNGKIRVIENPWYRGMSKEEAWKKAEEHIKATLDTGHMNMWRKYWQNDPKKTIQQNDVDFRNWYLEQVEDLAKNRMIGNVHMTDNFGYQDDHLAPGQGSTPFKELIRILKKHGYDKAWTVEPGADASTDISDFHGLMKAWRHFGSPVYGVGMLVQTPQTWTDVQYSYFGQSKPPYYIFGQYSPSNDWTLWSATPME